MKLLAASLLLAVLLCTPRAGATPDSPSFLEQLKTAKTENARLRVKLRREHRANKYHARIVRRLRREARIRWQPSVMHAIRLASTIWGVPQSELKAVGRCESHLNPRARNGIYRGVFQEGPMFEQGPFGQAGFSVFDPYANVFTAAFTVSRQGWRQWECKP